MFPNFPLLQLQRSADNFWFRAEDHCLSLQKTPCLICSGLAIHLLGGIAWTLEACFFSSSWCCTLIVSTVSALSLIIASGSPSSAGSARAEVAEHAFTRTKLRRRSLWIWSNAIGVPVLFLPALWYTTFLIDEGAQRWEEVYETEEALVLLRPAIPGTGRHAGVVWGALMPELCSEPAGTANGWEPERAWLQIVLWSILAKICCSWMPR